MSADTDRLIAQARNSARHLYSAEMVALADALEAAEAALVTEAGDRCRAEQGWADEALRAEAAEAQRDTLAEAARAMVESHWFQIRSEGSAYALVQALAGVAPPEEQP